MSHNFLGLLSVVICLGGPAKARPHVSVDARTEFCQIKLALYGQGDFAASSNNKTLPISARNNKVVLWLGFAAQIKFLYNNNNILDMNYGAKKRTSNFI